MSAFDRPVDVARSIDDLPRPRLIVFDCDGVLAPIVAHADDAVLSPGNTEALTTLAGGTDTTVAVLSGRSLAGLDQFGFDAAIEVVGSYGAERRGREGDPLDAEPRRLLDELTGLADDAAEGAGDGAWVEHKPASVVLHVREADDDLGATAVRRVRDDAERLHGVYVHEGKAVVELAVHRSDKGMALDDLVDELRPASVVYLGDDEPDEAAFAAIAEQTIPGVSVRIGTADRTAAMRRLADPAAVTDLLQRLAADVD